MKLRGLATRTRLLEAAREEFERWGLRGARLDRVTAQAQVTKGALYHHFRDKRALFLAAFDQAMEQELDTLWIRPFRETDDPLPRLAAGLSHYAQTWGQHPRGGGAFGQRTLTDMAAADPELSPHLARLSDRARERLTVVLIRARRAGLVRRDADCEAAALFILSSWRGCLQGARGAKAPLQACGTELMRYVATLAPLAACGTLPAPAAPFRSTTVTCPTA